MVFHRRKVCTDKGYLQFLNGKIQFFKKSLNFIQFSQNTNFSWTIQMDFAPSFFFPNVLKLDVCDADSCTCKDTPLHRVWKTSCPTPQASWLSRALGSNSISCPKGETLVPSVLTSALTPSQYSPYPFLICSAFPLFPLKYRNHFLCHE